MHCAHEEHMESKAAWFLYKQTGQEMHARNEDTQCITHAHASTATAKPTEICGKRKLKDEVLQLAAGGHRSPREPDGSKATLMRG